MKRLERVSKLARICLLVDSMTPMGGAYQERQALVPSLVTYHGTDARNLPSILRDGLRAQKPQGIYGYGVYLTADLEKAARYAVEGTSGQPVILEVRISKPHRVKKIYRDPLDQDEMHLYDDYQADGGLSEELERDIKDVLEFRGYGSLPRSLGLDLETGGDPARLRGINIYKSLINYARSEGMDLQKFKQRLFDTIPPGSEYGDWEISEDGTIILTKESYEGMHQKIYPDNLPPQSIKSVWLAGVPDEVSGERMEIQSKLLPQEVKYFVDTFNRISSDTYYDSNLDVSDALDYIVELDEDYGWLVEEIEALQVLAQSYQGAVGDDINRYLTAFKTQVQELGWAVDDFLLDPPGGKVTKFTKLSPQEALKYVGVQV